MKLARRQPSIHTVVILLFVIAFASGFVFAQKKGAVPIELDLAEFSPEAIKIVCNDEITLERTNMSSDECTLRAQDYVDRCLQIAKPLEAVIEPIDEVTVSSAENFAKHPAVIQFQSLATLYGNCINSYIFRSG